MYGRQRGHAGYKTNVNTIDHGERMGGGSNYGLSEGTRTTTTTSSSVRQSTISDSRIRPSPMVSSTEKDQNGPEKEESDFVKSFRSSFEKVRRKSKSPNRPRSGRPSKPSPIKQGTRQVTYEEEDRPLQDSSDPQGVLESRRKQSPSRQSTVSTSGSSTRQRNSPSRRRSPNLLDQSLEVVPSSEMSHSIPNETLPLNEFDTTHNNNITPEESNFDALFPTTSETPNTLREVRLNLFEKDEESKQVPRAQLQQAISELDLHDESKKVLLNEKEEMGQKISFLETEWKRSQLQIKRMLAEEVVEWFRCEEEAGSMMRKITNMKKREGQLQKKAEQYKESASKVGKSDAILQGYKDENLSLSDQINELKTALRRVRMETHQE